MLSFTEKYPDVATTVKDSLLKTVIVPSSLIVKETLVQEPELAVDDEGEVVPSSSQKVLKRKVKISFEGLPRSKGEAAKKGEEGEAGEADENKAEGGEKKDRKVKEEETNEVFSLPPELAEALQKPPSSFIVDTEVVAYDIAEHKILPFQVLSTRARKGVEAKDILVKVSPKRKIEMRAILIRKSRFARACPFFVQLFRLLVIYSLFSSWK